MKRHKRKDIFTMSRSYLNIQARLGREAVLTSEVMECPRNALELGRLLLTLDRLETERDRRIMRTTRDARVLRYALSSNFAKGNDLSTITLTGLDKQGELLPPPGFRFHANGEPKQLLRQYQKAQKLADEASSFPRRLTEAEKRVYGDAQEPDNSKLPAFTLPVATPSKSSRARSNHDVTVTWSEDTLYGHPSALLVEDTLVSCPRLQRSRSEFSLVSTSLTTAQALQQSSQETVANIPSLTEELHLGRVRSKGAVKLPPLVAEVQALLPALSVRGALAVLAPGKVPQKSQRGFSRPVVSPASAPQKSNVKDTVTGRLRLPKLVKGVRAGARAAAEESAATTPEPSSVVPLPPLATGPAAGATAERGRRRRGTTRTTRTTTSEAPVRRRGRRRTRKRTADKLPPIAKPGTTDDKKSKVKVYDPGDLKSPLKIPRCQACSFAQRTERDTEPFKLRDYHLLPPPVRWQIPPRGVLVPSPDRVKQKTWLQQQLPQDMWEAQPLIQPRLQSDYTQFQSTRGLVVPPRQPSKSCSCRPKKPELKKSESLPMWLLRPGDRGVPESSTVLAQLQSQRRTSLPVMATQQEATLVSNIQRQQAREARLKVLKERVSLDSQRSQVKVHQFLEMLKKEQTDEHPGPAPYLRI